MICIFANENLIFIYYAIKATIREEFTINSLDWILLTMIRNIPKSGPRPVRNNGKVAFRHCFSLDPDLKNSFYSELPKGMSFDVCISDFLVFLRGCRTVDENNQKITGSQLVSYLTAVMKRDMEKADILVMYTDKKAPMAKAVTQRGRIEDDIIPVAVDIKGETATKEEYRAIQMRQNKINRVTMIQEQRQETLAREKLITKEQKIPEPFAEFTGSKYRPEVMRFIVSCMIGDPNLAFFSGSGKCLIVDGHWLLPEHYPESIRSQVKSHIKTHDQLTRHERLVYRNTPIGIYGPQQKDIVQYDGDEFNDIVARSADSLPELKAETDFENDMGEFDAAFGLYILWMLVKRKKFRFLIRTTDSDCIVNALWLLFRIRNQIDSINLEYYDEEHEKTLSEEEQTVWLCAIYISITYHLLEKERRTGRKEQTTSSDVETVRRCIGYMAQLRYWFLCIKIHQYQPTLRPDC